MYRYRRQVLLLLAALYSLPAIGGDRELEIDAQRKFCAGMPINQALPNRSEVDCVLEDVAIEVDFSDHWAAAIGQSLQYGAMMGRRPGIILVCRTRTPASTCLRHKLKLEETMSYWNIGMMVWLCHATDPSLAECQFKDFFGPD